MENNKQKPPEFVVIEEDPAYHKQHFKQEDQYYSSFQSIKSTGDFPWVVRVAFFFGAVFLTIGALLTLFFFVFAAVMSVVTFFQLEDINQRVKSTWNLWKKLVSFLVGAIVGIFSPQFGLGIISTYLMLHNDTSVFMQRFVNRPWR